MAKRRWKRAYILLTQGITSEGFGTIDVARNCQVVGYSIGDSGSLESYSHGYDDNDDLVGPSIADFFHKGVVNSPFGGLIVFLCWFILLEHAITIIYYQFKSISINYHQL